jgi:hypothetical protein
MVVKPPAATSTREILSINWRLEKNAGDRCSKMEGLGGRGASGKHGIVDEGVEAPV